MDYKQPPESSYRGEPVITRYITRSSLPLDPVVKDLSRTYLSDHSEYEELVHEKMSSYFDTQFRRHNKNVEDADGHPLVSTKQSTIIDDEQASNSHKAPLRTNGKEKKKSTASTADSAPPPPHPRRTPEEELDKQDSRNVSQWAEIYRILFGESPPFEENDVEVDDCDGPPISLSYDLPRGPEMNDNWDGTVDQDLQRPRTWSPSDASLGGIKSFEVPGTINGIPVNALPDWGSAVDAVSEDFAKQNHLEIKRTGAQHIQLLGGHKAESVGQVTGLFKFRGESRVHRRVFHVLRKSMYDVILGRKFLNLTSTLTENYHRIVEKIRPCIQSKGRLFLLDESPNEHIRCTVNGAEASAFPDTGSDLMLVSGDFARRHNLKVRREERYRRQVELIDGSTVLTDGMVLNAELQFDIAPSASREVDYDRYRHFVDHLSSIANQNKTDATPRSTFVCDLHVIEGLPCDIILSNEFIFQNRVFSRFKDLFCPMSVLPSPGAIALDRSILFVRNKANKKSWLSRLRQAADNPEPEPIPLQAGPSWEERWVAEESRRNRAQLLIATLPHSRRSEAQRQEDEIRNAWDRGNPRPTPTSRLSSRNRPPPSTASP